MLQNFCKKQCVSLTVACDVTEMMFELTFSGALSEDKCEAETEGLNPELKFINKEVLPLMNIVR